MAKSLIEVTVRKENRLARLNERLQAGTVDSLRAAGAYIMGIARNSIKKSKRYADPGKPPHTRQGRLKKAIRFDVSARERNVVIGPTGHVAVEGYPIGHTHEFGGTEITKNRGSGGAPNWVLSLGGHGPVGLRGKWGKYDLKRGAKRTKAVKRTANRIRRESGGEMSKDAAQVLAQERLSEQEWIRMDRLRRAKAVSKLSDKLVFGKLKSQAQVRRARAIAFAVLPKRVLWEALDGKGKPTRRHYPARPFMGRALEVSKDRIPAFWKKSLRGA